MTSPILVYFDDVTVSSVRCGEVAYGALYWRHCFSAFGVSLTKCVFCKCSLRQVRPLTVAVYVEGDSIFWLLAVIFDLRILLHLRHVK